MNTYVYDYTHVHVWNNLLLQMVYWAMLDGE